MEASIQSEQSQEVVSDPHPSMTIKWGSATRVVRSRPSVWEKAKSNVCAMDRDPVAHDVMVAQIETIGHHSRMEIDNGRKITLYPGDLIGVVFGHRYATRQFYGIVPPASGTYDVLSQGGVCGRYLSGPSEMKTPTIIRPLGYLVDDLKRVINLRDFAHRPVAATPNVNTIIVVGSSMDAGKTTLAAGIVQGLHRAGKHVNAGKITGTACVKDTFRMLDAGARKVMDFSEVGFASTFNCSSEELIDICDTLITNLSADSPDYLVLEIADGIIQTETRLVLDYLSRISRLEHLALAVHDAMAAPTCIEMLRSQWNAEVTVVSGLATITPLSKAELQSLVTPPCWSQEELIRPDVESLFPLILTSAE